MKLWIEPEKQSGASRSMAIDRALLENIKTLDGPCFRHYTWETPAWSFGYSQRMDEVRKALKNKDALELVRRPTGGGIVSHKEDWTYALVLPTIHPLAQSSAQESYTAIHKAISAALNAIKTPSKLAPCHCDKKQKPGVCFDEPVAHDILNLSGKKIAGAAQKRTRTGLLIQGSIEKRVLKGKEPLFLEAFINALEETLQCSSEKHDHCPLIEASIRSWQATISSDAWLNLR